MRLRKSASFTRWDARPLSDEQVDYAREDVLHLLQVADALQTAARRPRAPGLGAGGVSRAGGGLRRARGRQRLRPPSAHQRPGRAGARRRARARRAGARRPPAPRTGRRPRCSTTRRSWRSRGASRPTPGRLGQIRGVSEPTLRRRGAGLLDAVARGREQQPIPPDGQRPPPPDAQDAPLIALGEALVRTRAMEAQLAYELIAARADLERIIRAQRDGLPEPDTRTLQGWRRQLVGRGAARAPGRPQEPAGRRGSRDRHRERPALTAG